MTDLWRPVGSRAALRTGSRGDRAAHGRPQAAAWRPPAPERELARILQVGRSSLREATAVLASQGLLTVKRGHGIYVAEPREPGSVTRGRPRSVSGMGSRGGSREDTAPSWVRHVVVPADSSPASLHGLALAADIARRTGARVTVVHVRHLPGGTSLSPASTRGPIAETLNEIEAEVRAAAAAVLESADVSWDLVVRSGSPGEQVLEAVKEGGGDLIIIGSKRHSSIHNVLLGSTSAYLAAHSPVPVLVARPQQETDNT